jgi:hypothetical protein
LQLLSLCTIAINPTVAGTGLKIKTVEAACLGLPTVCLPTAVEGLEDVAHRFALVARSADEFAKACLRLLENPDHWRALRSEALKFSRDRFSETTVYREVDWYMNWNEQVEERFAIRRAAYRSHSQQTNGKNVSASVNNNAWTLGCAAAELAASPTDLDAHCRMIRAFAELLLPEEAEQALRETALAFPLSAEIAALSNMLKHRFPHLTEEFGHAGPIYQIPLSETVRPLDLTTVGQPFGSGWGHVEEWGVWTVAPYAQLVFSIAESNAAMRLSLTLHATRGGIESNQAIRIYADDLYIGCFQIPRDRPAQTIICDLPVLPCSRDRIVLEFFVIDPAPFRNDDDIIVDTRDLGVGLHCFSVTPVS